MSFSYTIDSPKLSRGLRPSKRMPRNSGYLAGCSCAVGKDGVLQVLDELTRIDTSIITDSFPYPQIFVFTNLIVVCSSTKIYEYVGGSLIERLTVIPGALWTAMDVYDGVYLSNGNTVAIRDPMSNLWASMVDSALPRAMAICNFNSQTLVGAPDIDSGVPGASLTMNAAPIDLAVTQCGDWT